MGHLGVELRTISSRTQNPHFTAVRICLQSLTKGHTVFMSETGIGIGIPGIPCSFLIDSTGSHNILRNRYKTCLQQFRTFSMTLI